MMENAHSFFRQARRARIADDMPLLIPGVLRMNRKGIRRALSTRGRGPVLDHLNEALVARNVTLHPTKGYRSISAARLKASAVVEALKSGALRHV